jgi:hypothetical protein
MLPDHIACCKQLLLYVSKRASTQAAIAVDASAFVGCDSDPLDVSPKSRSARIKIRLAKHGPA